ncbi:hypothetical protein LSM04_000422 [Trypanosoma melophagium]|uniref:uncharacterized protein n=1 Tax=Trypanosoma melophagium TaxID=715481 RepID=UPI00351A57CF|nr:hypothetical protein LSM04_000422 [Trypanosoma melophagium]
MGYKVSPEILQTVTSVIAGLPEVVRPAWAAPRELRLDVWIDNICISGALRDVIQWEHQIKHWAEECQATIGEVDSGAHSYTFLGFDFDHKSRSVALSKKCVGKLRAIRPLRMWTVAEMEVAVSLFLYAAAILGIRLTTYFFFVEGGAAEFVCFKPRTAFGILTGPSSTASRTGKARFIANAAT